jgi:ActD protein
MKAVYALYRSPESAQRAFEHLKKAGLAERRITVLSSEPMEEYEFGQRDRRTIITWLAAGGGALGLLGAYLLTSITQKVWAIDTGGMPIVTNWTNMIVIFELTMLSAIVTTVITLLVTANIPSWKTPELYDPLVSEGRILIGVTNPTNPSLIETTLQSSGGGIIKKVE